MSTLEILIKAQELVMPWGKGSVNPQPNRLDVIVQSQDLFQAVETLKSEQWGYLSAITGLDLGVSS